MSIFDLSLHPHQYKGKLVVFDGIDGSGKTTLLRQARNVVSSLGLCAEEVQLIDPTLWSAPPIQKYMQDPCGAVEQGVDLLGLSLVCTGFRLNSIRSTVLPKLNVGTWVFCDRYVYTTLAEFICFPSHAQEGEILRDLLRLLPKPDLAFLASASAEVCMSRIREREAERGKILDVEYYKRLVIAFDSVAAHNDMVRVDTEIDPAESVSFIKRRMLGLSKGD